MPTDNKHFVLDNDTAHFHALHHLQHLHQSEAVDDRIESKRRIIKIVNVNTNRAKKKKKN